MVPWIDLLVDRRRRAGCMGVGNAWKQYIGICMKDCLNRYILLLLLSPPFSLNDIESGQKFMSSIKI
jgi:hypothetical protein